MTSTPTSAVAGARLARRRRPRRRAHIPRPFIAAVLVVAAAGLLYVAARQTSMFALRTVVVTGAPKPVAADVRSALAPLLGRSLVGLSPSTVETLVTSLPTVVSAAADRDYPHTIRVAVLPERPVAVVRQLQDSWLVSSRGRIMQRLDLGAMPRLPRIWLAASVKGLSAGSVLLPDQGGLAVRVVADLPRRFPLQAESAGGTPDALTVMLRGPVQLRLGDASNLALKLRVAAALLRSLSSEERATVAYVDVGLPGRPVTGQNPQVESQT